MKLGWKLAAVVHGEGPSSLLDSYGQERRPVAEQVLDWSRAQVALLRPDAGAAALRNVVRDLMDTGDGSTYFAGRVWGAGLRYAPLAATHPLIGRSAPDVMLADGRRLNEALRSGRPLLFDFDPADPLAEIAGAFPRLDYAIAGTHFDPVLTALLVRPDGIVAWAGSTSDHAAVCGAIARLLDPQRVA